MAGIFLSLDRQSMGLRNMLEGEHRSSLMTMGICIYMVLWSFQNVFTSLSLGVFLLRNVLLTLIIISAFGMSPKKVEDEISWFPHFLLCNRTLFWAEVCSESLTLSSSLPAAPEGPHPAQVFMDPVPPFLAIPHSLLSEEHSLRVRCVLRYTLEVVWGVLLNTREPRLLRSWHSWTVYHSSIATSLIIHSLSHSLIYSFVHSTNKYLQSTYIMSGTSNLVNNILSLSLRNYQLVL